MTGHQHYAVEKASLLLLGERVAREEVGPRRMHGDMAISLQQTGIHRGAARDTPEKSRTA